MMSVMVEEAGHNWASEPRIKILTEVAIERITERKHEKV